MRAKTELFKINGKPFLVPDAEVSIKYEDLVSSDSGRDEAGYMRRIVLRHKVPTWSFRYENLTEEEKNYMESLFAEENDFQFSHPARKNAEQQETTVCYRNTCSIAWKNAVTGLWGGYAFDIVSC